MCNKEELEAVPLSYRESVVALKEIGLIDEYPEREDSWRAYRPWIVWLPKKLRGCINRFDFIKGDPVGVRIQEVVGYEGDTDEYPVSAWAGAALYYKIEGIEVTDERLLRVQAILTEHLLGEGF